MRPRQPNNPGKKGKQPAPKRRRRAPSPEVESDGSWERDERVDNAAAPAPVVVQIDDDLPPQPHHLPDELMQLPARDHDMSDEEGEDHTGFWRPEDLEQLVHAINHFRNRLRGKFTGTSGGKERKDRAWASVAEYVNTRCGTHWTVGQCKGKTRRACLLVKQKYNRLRRELMKTGNRAIPDRMYLTRLEEMLLDYVGVEGVIGIPGLHAVPLRPDLGRDYLALKTNAAQNAWDHDRADRPDYRAPLDQGRVRMERRN